MIVSMETDYTPLAYRTQAPLGGITFELRPRPVRDVGLERTVSHEWQLHGYRFSEPLTDEFLLRHKSVFHAGTLATARRPFGRETQPQLQ